MINNDLKKIIYEVRGKKIVLDSDIASLYGMETKRLNETIKRNIDMFSENDYFKLTKEEFDNLKSQFVTSKEDFATFDDEFATFEFEKMYGRRKYYPYVFTKNGVEILSKIIKKDELKNINNELINLLDDKKYEIVKTSSSPVIIEDLIIELRGKQVIMDYDLAKLYECTNGAKTINLAVKRHPNRFPKDFYFQLTEEEQNFVSLRFQIETLKNGRGEHKKYLSYAFTEQGCYMLSTVIRTKVAAEVCINIMRAFTFMKNYISNNIIEQKYLNEQIMINTSNINDNKKMINKHDNDIKLLKEMFSEFKTQKVNECVFFEGKLYDAYSKIKDIFNEANKNLIIIDSYLDKSILDIISNVDANVILITKKNNKLSKIDIEKYNMQYNNLIKIIYNDTYHDRFFVLDEKIIYHCGASINHAGKRTFAITEIISDNIKEKLLDDIKNIINNV